MSTTFLYFLIPLSIFTQKLDAVQNETEKLIQSVIETDVNLKTGHYIVYEKLEDLQIEDLKYWANKYNFIENRFTSDTIINKINLKIISRETLNCYKKMADSLNHLKHEPFEMIDEYRLVSDKTGKTFCEFSKPFFSKNGNFALVKFEVYSGFLYGSFSYTLIMKKEKLKWIPEEIVSVSSD